MKNEDNTDILTIGVLDCGCIIRSNASYIPCEIHQNQPLSLNTIMSIICNFIEDEDML